MSLADPWSSGSSDSNNDATAPTSLQFEDNFEPSSTGVTVSGANSSSSSDIQQPRDGRLPDSDSYLAVLGNYVACGVFCCYNATHSFILFLMIECVIRVLSTKQ